MGFHADLMVGGAVPMLAPPPMLAAHPMLAPPICSSNLDARAVQRFRNAVFLL
jgi:hypothetical protein